MGDLFSSFMWGGSNGTRRRGQAASAYRQRPRRRHRRATAEWRHDRPHRTIDDRQGFGPGVLRGDEFWRGRLRYSPRFEAYELDLDEDELRRAPSFRADADFDWGDRSQEATASRLIGAASEVCVP